MKRPLFSCVIPVKGARPYLDEALESLLSQGMGDDLEIIVQDGDVGMGNGERGTGNGEGIPRRPKGVVAEGDALAGVGMGNGVRWYREADKGQSDALNKGFSKAKGEWLFWLNADDVLLPGALKSLELKVKSLEFKDVEWIAGDMVVIDGEGKIVRCQKDRGSFRAYEGKPIRVFGPSSFFRRELFERVGGFDVNLRYCMDTDLWCRFREVGAWFKKTGIYVWGFREHEGSTTTGAKKPGEQSRQDREVVAMHERRGVKMTAADVRALRLRRLLDGSFIKAIFDTIRFKGKKWSEIK